MRVKDRQGKHSSRCSSEAIAVEYFELTWHRLRVKHTIAGLERRVEGLTQQLIALKLEKDSLKAENQLASIGCIPQQMQPNSILMVPNEIYPGVEAVVQRRNLQASQYVPSTSQFAQPLVMHQAKGTGDQSFYLYSRSLTDTVDFRTVRRLWDT